ncbi:MAG: glycolate oxidase iron-sulfur subunit [Thiobacillus sp. 65-69]|nr:glycolate oxidase subunit GlcF [Thiobacillus sp.]ODU89220.1 MAG: glycolate oxidase iron-sulfur subunit [Thiobacillus sp. SCN 65-179]OJW34533.1 MAG: glycolate oxidase iron-sulfur subunit [Thiobacillus sp. 65-69]
MKVDLAEQYRDTPLGREAETLIRACVICGQCEPVCPTFRLLDEGWDGPRGRIYLTKLFLEGKDADATSLPPALSYKMLEGRSLAANLQLHLDRCLSCRSCETSCPQGVHYGRLLDIGRELVERSAPRPLKERLVRRAVRGIVTHPHRFSALLRAGQTVRRLLPEVWRARVPERRAAGTWPQRTHARRMLAWQGCVQPALAPDINAAAARVLDRFGIRLDPAADGCCGVLSHHMAEAGEARRRMRQTIDALWPHIENGIEALVLTASGCGMHFRDYGALLDDDPAYRDKARRVSELTRDIAEIVFDEWKAAPGEVPPLQSVRRIAFQSSCSLQHGEKLNGVVEKLLRRAGFRLVQVTYPFMCCGAAGAYSLLQREMSEALRERKLETLLERHPAEIATANIGCLTHLAAASPVPVKHWIELLDEVLPPASA